MQLILVDLDCFVSSFTKPWGFPFEFWYFLLSSVVWSQSYQKPGFPGGWLSVNPSANAGNIGVIPDLVHAAEQAEACAP